MRNHLFLSLSIFLLSSCGLSSPVDNVATSIAAEDTKSLKIDLFSARGFLGGSEYERYHLANNILWRECGSVAPATKAATNPSMEGDDVFLPNPKLNIQERRVEKLKEDKLSSIYQEASKLTEVLDTSTEKPPAPGSVFSLSSPGVFEITLEYGNSKKRIVSSVDAVADKLSPALEKAHELFAALRGAGPLICGAETFYGIERKES